ncbi:tetraspanin-33 isoform 2-T2 [Guaruba guarouba]
MESPEAGGTVPPEEDFSFVSPIVKFVLFFFNLLFWVISMVMVAVGVYAWLLKHAGEVGGLVGDHNTHSEAPQCPPCSGGGVGGLVVMAPHGRGDHGVPGGGPRHPPHRGRCPHLPHCLLWLHWLLAGEHRAAAGGESMATWGPPLGHPTGLWPLCCGPPWPSDSSHPQFSICLAIIFLLQLVAGVLGFVFSDKARGKVSEIINGAIMHYRDDLDLQNLIDFGQKEFSCCGGVSYKDWSQNMYFNCTMDNPSQERCSVPFSCCLPDDNEVRLVSSWGILSSSILWMGAELPQQSGTPQSSRVCFLSPGCHQHHVWTWHTGHGLRGGQRCHLHPWLHRQPGQLDQQEPLPAGGHCAGAGSPTAGGHPAGSDPHQPDQRPDQAAALQPAAPGRPFVLIPVHSSVCPRRDFQTLDP